MKKEIYLLKVNKSRRSYFFTYLMVLIVISVLAYLNFQGYEFGKIVWIISLIFIIGEIIYVEISRIREWWAISNSSLVHSVSILNKNIRESDFASISDLDLDQSFFKRILNFGTINVRLFQNETSICIKNINNPRSFIEELQRMISLSRGRNDGTRKT